MIRKLRTMNITKARGFCLTISVAEHFAWLALAAARRWPPSVSNALSTIGQEFPSLTSATGVEYDLVSSRNFRRAPSHATWSLRHFLRRDGSRSDQVVLDHRRWRGRDRLIRSVLRAERLCPLAEVVIDLNASFGLSASA